MRQPHKMVRHTPTIRRQKPTNCLSVFDHVVGVALKGLTMPPVLGKITIFDLLSNIADELFKCV